MSQSIVCVYCGKPLIDADHAKKHVMDKCQKSPSKRLADVLTKLLTSPGWTPEVVTEARNLLAELGRKL